MQFHVITIFPEVCASYTSASVLGRAQKVEKGKGAKVKGKQIDVAYYNPRDFATDKHKKVDERPYGGGPGMVMMAEPILKAWEKAVGKKTASAEEREGEDLDYVSARDNVYQ
jgi:tRNA (guanine37-N1)-methyltransferase